jgi:putative transposase
LLSRTVAALRAAPPAVAQANASRADPPDLISFAAACASQNLVPKVLRRPIEFAQYAADEYQRVLRQHGISCSMSRRGNCWDNAVTESFFGTLKIELIDRRPWPTQRAAKDAVANYIEGFYNPHRLHSSLGYTSPNEFERRHSQKVTHAA